ncbi:ribonuclease HII [Patescibacteria group bacterium]|nr:ribonuclease HII [Patescibacteria group bacterium]MBU1868762.1 ribonuclease HII [Patescibacteria group bacterium]
MLNLKAEKSLWKKGYHLLAGIDEAGRGAWAGPLVAAAVAFTQKSKIPAGINDSKQLSPTKRLSLANAIIKSGTDYGLGIVSAEQIDQKGIIWATQLAFYRAVKELTSKPEMVLTDAYPINKLDPEKQKAIIRGDQQILSIAAASIIAKVYRDWLMSQIYHIQYPQYYFQKHKGYGTQQHRELINKWGTCSIHRRSYLRSL